MQTGTGPSDPTTDASPRWALALVALAVGAFIVILALAPARFMGVDDAYYLGIGENLFAGNGATSVFGAFAFHHSPLWPALIYAPKALLGIDPAPWTHALVILGGAATIGISAWLAARWHWAAGALAAAVLLAFPFLVETATGLGLDLPATALTLLYLALGLTAVRRDSLGLAAVAGIVLAAAFLTKETALPFAPVPFIAGLVRMEALAAVIRTTAATLLAAVAGTSWWFVVHGVAMGTVYRVGLPAWTLVPLGVGIVGVGLIGLAARRWLPAGEGSSSASPRLVRRLGWLGVAVWVVGLTVFFARAETGLGTSFLDLEQLRRNVTTRGIEILPILAVGLPGAVLAIALRFGRRTDDTDVRPPVRDAHAIDDLLVGLCCGLPLLLLVASVGEGPRHYLTELALLAALGSVGWVALAVRAIARPSARTAIVAALALASAGLIAAPFVLDVASPSVVLRFGVVALVGLIAVIVVGRLVERSAAGRRVATVPGLLTTMAVISAAVVAAIGMAWWAAPGTANAADAARAEAVRTAVAWAEANLEPGSTVAFGGGLAFETAVALGPDVRPVQMPEDFGVHVDPSSPLGLRPRTNPGASDWVALRASGTDVASLYGYRAGLVRDRLRDLGVDAWIQTEYTTSEAAAPMSLALEAAEGAERVASWSWPYASGRLETNVFRIDPERLAFPDRVVLTTTALERIVDGLSADQTTAAPVARALLDRVALRPDDPAGSPLLDRLRSLAGA